MKTHFKNNQRKLRGSMPAPEVHLWRHLRRGEMGVKFRRQYALEDRIIDFYAPTIKLAIEIDGDSHFVDEKKKAKDSHSDAKWLREYDIKVLRFGNADVLENTLSVLEVIKSNIDARKSFTD